MNEQYASLSLFFGGFGLLFIVFAAANINCDCILPTLIFVLFHTVLVVIAFPLFLSTLFSNTVSPGYSFTVIGMSTINAIMMFIVSYLDESVSRTFIIAAELELLPLVFILMKYGLHLPKSKPVTN